MLYYEVNFFELLTATPAGVLAKGNRDKMLVPYQIHSAARVGMHRQQSIMNTEKHLSDSVVS